jgi:DNA invertase Pin-like site-specific DNA recombinase
VVSELRRMGRSVGEILTTVDVLVKQQVQFIAIKDGVRLNGKQDLQSKVMVTLFGLFADIERELISMRMKEGLAAAWASGKRLGRPKGKLGHPGRLLHLVHIHPSSRNFLENFLSNRSRPCGVLMHSVISLAWQPRDYWGQRPTQ